MFNSLASNLHHASLAMLSNMAYQPWLASVSIACGFVAYYCIRVVKVGWWSCGLGNEGGVGWWRWRDGYGGVGL